LLTKIKFLAFIVLVSQLKVANAEIIIHYAKNIVAPDLICPITQGVTTTIKAPLDDPLEIPDDSDINEIINQEIKKNITSENIINLRKRSGTPSIGIWGDSHIGAYFFTEELIRQMGLTSSDVAQQYFPPTFGRAGVRLPVKKYCRSNDWIYNIAYKANVLNTSRGLIEMESSVPNSYLWIDFRKSSRDANLKGLRIPIATNNSSARVGITIDDNEEFLVDIKSTGNTDYISVESDYLFATIKLRLISGKLVVKGFMPVYAQPPKIYLDTFGIPGATMNGWSKNIDSTVLNTGDSKLYDVVILEYGTNEGNDANFDPLVYRKNLSLNLQNVKKLYPDAECILIGPTDRGVLVKRSKKQKGKIPKSDLLKFSQRHQLISDIQEEEGKKFNCSFWSWQESMGGLGSSYRWLKQNPQLMSKDLTHLTVQGYQASAQKFYKKFNLNIFND